MNWRLGLNYVNQKESKPVKAGLLETSACKTEKDHKKEKKTMEA